MIWRNKLDKKTVFNQLRLVVRLFGGIPTLRIPMCDAILALMGPKHPVVVSFAPLQLSHCHFNFLGTIKLFFFKFNHTHFNLISPGDHVGHIGDPALWTQLWDVDQPFPPLAQPLHLYKAAERHNVGHPPTVDLKTNQWWRLLINYNKTLLVFFTSLAPTGLLWGMKTLLDVQTARLHLGEWARNFSKYEHLQLII